MANRARLGLISPDGSLSPIDRRTLLGDYLNDESAIIIVVKPLSGLKTLKITRRATNTSSTILLTVNKGSGVSGN